MRRPLRLLPIIFLALVLRAGAAEPPCDTADAALRTVVRVIDGDTIELDHGERVRLIGVDTPETVHPRKPVEYFGHEASAFTTRRLQGKTVHLGYDWQRTDKYGRTLAFVCLEGELVNEEIVREGTGSRTSSIPSQRPSWHGSALPRPLPARHGAVCGGAPDAATRSSRSPGRPARAPQAAPGDITWGRR
jgi:hypothetical protein